MLPGIEAEEAKRRNNQQFLERHVPKPPLVSYPFFCTLEELYHGGEKLVPVLRRVFDESGKQRSTFQAQVTVRFPPGFGAGEKVKVSKVGDLLLVKMPGDPHTVYTIHGDAAFVVHQQAHNVFQRKGCDLWTTRKISLMTALTGEPITVKTLDHRFITIPHTDPTSTAQFPNEGMPVPNAGVRGSLFIKYQVLFPANLSFTDEQKIQLRKLLDQEVENHPIQLSLENGDHENDPPIQEFISENNSNDLEAEKNHPNQELPEDGDKNDEVQIQKKFRSSDANK